MSCSQFNTSWKMRDAMGGRDDVSVADERTPALEVNLGVGADSVAEIGQPRKLTKRGILKKVPLLLWSRQAKQHAKTIL
jgi:hypothetical protein